jgi:hypothetical protein
MLHPEIMQAIKSALEKAPRNSFVMELHLQVIKYSKYFEAVDGKEFCSTLEISPAYVTEFNKLRKLLPRLESAGLDVSKI